jgi:hypothetical protein
VDPEVYAIEIRDSLPVVGFIIRKRSVVGFIIRKRSHDMARLIFLLHGSWEHWKTAQAKSFWGLPRHGRKVDEIKAELQAAGFIPGVEILGVAGPKACLRAVVEGDERGHFDTVYFDDTDASFGMDKSNDTYPVRFKLTRIQKIDRPWYRIPTGSAFKEVLREVYFSENCMFVFRDGIQGDSNIDWQVVLGDGLTTSGATPPSAPGRVNEKSAPESFEDQVSDVIAGIGLRVVQLGHTRRFDRVPDGLACLPRSLAEHMGRMNDKPYFLLWDCKFDCGAQGLTAADERAIREYIVDFGKQQKLALMVPEFWFLIVSPNSSVADRIRHSLERATWPDDLREFGCRGVRVITVDWLNSLATKATDHRRSGQDPDSFFGHLVPRMLKTGQLG